MPEPRTDCIDCGTSIMQRIATRLEGRCVRCSSKAKAIPPQDFQLPHDLAARVAALHANHEYYREMTWQHGTNFTHEFLNKKEETQKLYLEWFPRLRAFADQCRIDYPLPTDESLSNSERAQQQIYQDKFGHGMQALGREMSVTICCMPALAISIADRLWPRNNIHTILLTRDEKEQWNEMYTHPEGSFEWFSQYSWHVDTSPEQKIVLSDDYTITQWEPEDIPQNEQPWLVSVSQWHGPLSAAGHTELWTWNGSQARFIKKVSDWVS
ncbi:MAG: hypothetical protein QM703_13115 [Gemmatales bacterium]